MITKFNFKDKTIKSYAIRKLTPFECFRLMGVRDDVITFLLFYLYDFVLTNIIFFHTFTPSNRGEEGVRGSPSCLILCNHILRKNK